MFSARTAFADAPNAVTARVQSLIAGGTELLDLTCGNPTQVGLAWDAGILQDALSQNAARHYQPEPFGLLAPRKTLSARFNLEGFAISPEDIMLTASTSEAYGYLFKLLCNPGDRVLVPTPSYPLFDVLAGLEGVELVPYRLAYDGEWHIDPSIVSLAKESAARAIFVVHPNNPTGSFLKRSELALLTQTGLPVVSDEVFAEYGFASDPTRAVSALELAEQLVFRLGGASKSLALPQLKLAWTAIQGPSPIVTEARRRLEHIADAYLSPSTPAQLALDTLLLHANTTQERIRTRCRENRKSLCDVFHAGTAVSVLNVEGGWYAIVRLPSLMEEEAWVLSFLEQDHVLVQPGYFFDLAGQSHIVISLISEPNVLRKATTKIAENVLRVVNA